MNSDKEIRYKMKDVKEFLLFQLRNVFFIGILVLTGYMATIANAPIFLINFMIWGVTILSIIFIALMLYNCFVLAGRLMREKHTWHFI